MSFLRKDSIANIRIYPEQNRTSYLNALIAQVKQRRIGVSLDNDPGERRYQCCTINEPVISTRAGNFADWQYN